MRKSGFSLVELSVVLVIIGILIGGIVAAKTMIASTRRTALISDWQKYSTSANSYFSKYNYWPGDDAEATNKWAGATVGSGDGALGIQTSQEYMYFWQDLALAGFITGSYTGAWGSVPTAPIPDSYMTHYYDSTGSNATNQALYVTGTRPATFVGYSSSTGTAILTARGAAGIDVKIDDGIYNTGNVIAPAGCTYTNASTSNSTALACNLY